MIDSKTRNHIRVLVADSSRIHTHLLADALKRDLLFEVIPCDSDANGLMNNPKVNNISALLTISAMKHPARVTHGLFNAGPDEPDDKVSCDSKAALPPCGIRLPNDHT